MKLKKQLLLNIEEDIFLLLLKERDKQKKSLTEIIRECITNQLKK